MVVNLCNLAVPKLTVSVDEAQEKIALQLTRGKRISRFLIRSVKDLEACESRYYQWHDFTKSLLEYIDSNHVLVKDFHYLTPSVSSGTRSLLERIRGFRYNIRKDVDNLQSIYKKIPLLKKPKVKKKTTKKKRERIVDAHFFFVDIVGLSNPELSSTEEQIMKIDILNKLIKSCKSFRTIKKSDRLVQPTGDGMVVGFTNELSSPLELAIELHKKLKLYNHGKKDPNKIKIRIGIHSAPVLRFLDINNQENIWGEGIIVARRIMDLGEDDHILLSSKIAEELIQLSKKYKKIIHKVGKRPIKHSYEITVYSAYGDCFGNKKSLKMEKFKVAELVKSGKSKLKQEIELLKSKKKQLEISKKHEITLWNESYSTMDESAFRATLSELDSMIADTEVKIIEKIIELTS